MAYPCWCPKGAFLSLLEDLSPEMFPSSKWLKNAAGAVDVGPFWWRTNISNFIIPVNHPSQGKKSSVAVVIFLFSVVLWFGKLYYFFTALWNQAFSEWICCKSSNLLDRFHTFLKKKNNHRIFLSKPRGSMINQVDLVWQKTPRRNAFDFFYLPWDGSQEMRLLFSEWNRRCWSCVKTYGNSTLRR